MDGLFRECLFNAGDFFLDGSTDGLGAEVEINADQGDVGLWADYVACDSRGSPQHPLCTETRSGFLQFSQGGLQRLLRGCG